VEFDGAGHFAWTDLRGTYQPTIDAYGVAFFDRYLKGKPFPPSLTRPDDNVTVVKVAE
jgi:hypothetical protein